MDLVFGCDDERGEYLEYYGIDKFGPGARGRFYGDGAHVDLEVMQEMFEYFPGDAPSSKAAEAAMLERNGRIAEELRRAGFADDPHHDLIADALPHAGAILREEWRHMLDGPHRENRFRSAVRISLEHEVGGLVQQERRVDLGADWPNRPPRVLGGVDLLVSYMPGGAYWRYLAELKWSTPHQLKVWEGIWDALKMLTASQLLYVEGAYLITGASLEEWRRPTKAGELFADGVWDVREILSKYPREWKELVEKSGPPPLRLPLRFRTTLVAEQPVNHYLVRAVSVSSVEPLGEQLELSKGYLV